MLASSVPPRPPGKKCRRLEVSELDETAFVTIMEIIHGHNREVPNLSDLDHLTRIAVIVDLCIMGFPVH